MSGKTIEIEKGDTFTITELGALFRYSGRKCFHIDGSSAGSKRTSGERDITAAQFRTIAEIAGYAVTEKPAEAEAVVVTHGVKFNRHHGVCAFVGDLASCREYAKCMEECTVVPIRFGGASNG